jgi:geranylgeranyl pyrophosphate synthase
MPLERYRPQLADCRERLRAITSQTGGAPLAAMVDEAKLLRATLVVAAGAPLGASASALLPASVAIELLHLASLVHDDIIDEATERRGGPALHVAVGRDRALVVGDLLIVAAFAELAGVSARAVAVLGGAAQRCCFGQLEELDPARPDPSEEAYLDVVARKTGALFSAAASLGALAAGADDAALAELGTALGVAYQIRDDLSDGASFSPTAATYERALHAAHAALERAPAPCRETIGALLDAMLVTRGRFAEPTAQPVSDR